MIKEHQVLKYIYILQAKKLNGGISDFNWGIICINQHKTCDGFFKDGSHDLMRSVHFIIT